MKKIFLSTLILIVLINFVSSIMFSAYAGGFEGENIYDDAQQLNGLYYTVANGEATVTGCDTSITGNKIIIPSSFNGYPVTSIGLYAFDFCGRLEKVYYCGTKDEWSKININPNNQYLILAKTYYNYGKKIDASPTVENLIIVRQVLLRDDNDLLIDYNSDYEVDIRDLICLKEKLAGIVS